MPSKIIDRGSPLQGINRTVRDAKVPFNAVRSMDNLRLPDGRVSRRLGYEEYSTARFHGNQLSKQTGTLFRSIDATETGAGAFRVFNGWYRGPHSYGLIRWHNDFQPKIASDWTLEFLLTLGEEEDLLTARRRRKMPSWITTTREVYARRSLGGVYVYDQLLISNNCSFSDDGGTTTFTLPYTSGTNYKRQDTVALPALGVLYSKDGSGNLIVECEFTTVETSGANKGRYLRGAAIRTGGSSNTYAYSPGDTYHVAVVYDSTGNGTLTLYVTPINSGTIDADPGIFTNVGSTGNTPKWVGEADGVNSLDAAVAANAIHRDIVLLNEGTVRGNYSSSCAFRDPAGGTNGRGSLNVLYDHVASTEEMNPWCMSPPRGTGMLGLRFWSEARSTADLLSGHAVETSLSPVPANLDGYWKLSDGGGLLVESIGGRNGTVHHGLPQYVRDTGFLHDVGLSFADGQHMIASYTDLAYKYQSDVAVSLKEVFKKRRSYTVANAVDHKGDFTVQMQFKVPYTLQQDISAHNTASTGYGMRFWDGEGETNRSVCKDTSSVEQERDDAFYQTLFSIEGSQNRESADTSNLAEWTMVPVAQGMLRPDGKLVFRVLSKHYTGSVGFPSIRSVVSTTTLAVSTVYTVTFRKRTDMRGGSRLTHLDIIIDGTTDATTSMNESDWGEHSDDKADSNIGQHSRYDIIVGSSRVNDVRDDGLNLADTSSVGFGAIPGRLQEGNQHFMNHFSDQPGFFSLGYFRLWSVGITDGEVSRTSGSTLQGGALEQSLLLNVELDQITGSRVPSRARYPEVMWLGFKSYGTATRRTPLTLGGAGEAGLAECPSGWAVQDALGYRTQPSGFDRQYQEASCRLLGPFASVLKQQSGLLSVMDDSLLFDDGFTGTFSDLPVSSHGLLSDFTPGQDWEVTVVGDRSFLTSRGGVPKVFDGKECSRAGVTQWQGGTLYASLTTGGSLPVDRWIAVYVAYVSESTGVSYISEPLTIKTSSTSRAVRIFNVPDHFDPKVTAVYVYRTAGQFTRSLALSAAARLVFVGPVPVKSIYGNSDYIELNKADSDLFPVVLDRSMTPMPTCAYSASQGGRLYLAGHLLVPDAVYWSDAGAPERFDVVGNSLILEEGRGDKINGIVSAFGSVFVFKAHSIWRIDEVASGQMQATKVSDGVGSIGSGARSIASVTIPESGVQTVVFWSEYGPYIFDGSRLRYIGYELEESVLSGPYQWMDPSSVLIMHDAASREIVFFYKSLSTGDENTSGVVDKAVVYNYRSGAWYRGSGLSGSYATNVVSTASSAVSGATTTQDQLGFALTQDFLGLLGNTNGKVYRWGRTSAGARILTDGRPAGAANYDDRPMLSYSTAGGDGILTISGDPGYAAESLRGLWCLVKKVTSGVTEDWYLLPIKDNQINAGNAELRLDITYWNSTLPFTPSAAGSRADVVTIGLPAGEVEFPWDELDMPVADKEVLRLLLWTNSTWSYRYAKDWGDVDAQASLWSTWSSRAPQANGSKRVKIELNKHVESLKLALACFSTDARLDAYAYEVDYSRDVDRLEATV